MGTHPEQNGNGVLGAVAQDRPTDIRVERADGRPATVRSSDVSAGWASESLAVNMPCRDYEAAVALVAELSLRAVRSAMGLAR